MEPILNLFNDYAPMIAVIPVIVGVNHYKKLSPVSQIFTWIFLLYFLRDVFGFVLWKTNSNPNFANNAEILLEVPLLFTLFKKAGIYNVRMLRIVTVLYISLFVFVLYDFFILGQLTEHKYNSYAMSSIILILTGIIYLFDFVLYSDLELRRLPISIYIVSSLILITIIYIIFYIIIEKFNNNQQELSYIWAIRNMLFILFCMIAIIILSKDKSHSNEY